MNKPVTLARRVDHRHLAGSGRGVAGVVALSQLQRVAAATADGSNADPVAVELFFSEDAQRRVYVAGTIRATLALTCQRCLESYPHRMDIAVSAVVVGDDEAAARVPRDDEPVVADDDGLDVHGLVSDELLLAMPGAAHCERADCKARFERAPRAPESPAEHASDEADRQDNPFAVLSQLKRDD